ncbi:uncharacterized protein yjr067c homologue, putative [Candida dubliniensis CD36]|uniref:Protein YAE1 n=1 Tax=Candida dubliniensis (strain CD36 / ATCC MYA-646 / CBS 7987 / NCPF 3949 / NRRL Y-17841) TaxID=573826 RepID=B9WJI4_CANDC|nr:uncharacterized protein yjr067c homologue, putative [Candida dubliniensis CD36]CAX40628.1 uncharacterized protein yjr067c homologue, putative [Candida dubliniensis CD36]
MTCQGDCSCKNNEVPTTKSTTGNVEDDDIWSDDDSKLILENDIIRSHYKKGYVDGITQSKESSLQQGFDDGYPEGAKLGIQVGKILANLINQCETKDEQLTRFNEAKKELNIVNVLKKSYFDEDLNLKKSNNPTGTNESYHELINKWENEMK